MVVLGNGIALYHSNDYLPTIMGQDIVLIGYFCPFPHNKNISKRFRP